MRSRSPYYLEKTETETGSRGNERRVARRYAKTNYAEYKRQGERKKREEKIREGLAEEAREEKKGRMKTGRAARSPREEAESLSLHREEEVGRFRAEESSGTPTRSRGVLRLGAEVALSWHIKRDGLNI